MEALLSFKMDLNNSKFVYVLYILKLVEENSGIGINKLHATSRLLTELF